MSQRGISQKDRVANYLASEIRKLYGNETDFVKRAKAVIVYLAKHQIKTTVEDQEFYNGVWNAVCEFPEFQDFRKDGWLAVLERQEQKQRIEKAVYGDGFRL